MNASHDTGRFASLSGKDDPQGTAGPSRRPQKGHKRSGAKVSGETLDSHKPPMVKDKHVVQKPVVEKVVKTQPRFFGRAIREEERFGRAIREEQRREAEFRERAETERQRIIRELEEFFRAEADQVDPPPVVKLSPPVSQESGPDATSTIVHSGPGNTTPSPQQSDHNSRSQSKTEPDASPRPNLTAEIKCSSNNDVFQSATPLPNSIATPPVVAQEEVPDAVVQSENPLTDSMATFSVAQDVSPLTDSMATLSVAQDELRSTSHSQADNFLFGIFIITNVRHKLSAALEDKNEKCAPVVAKADQSNDFSKWKITRRSDGQFHIHNHGSPEHAIVSNYDTTGEKDVEIQVDRDAQPWTIQETKYNKGRYNIYFKGNEFCWGLPYNRDEDPYVELADKPLRKQNHWIIHKEPLGYEAISKACHADDFADMFGDQKA